MAWLPKGGARPGGRRTAFNLRAKFIVAYVVPMGILLSVMSWLAHGIAAHYLDRELGRRLQSVALAVTAVPGNERAATLLPGDETTRTYRAIEQKLATMRDTTGVRRLLIFDPRNRVLVDSDSQLPVGTPYFRLAADRVEVERAAAVGAADSVSFRGEDNRMYKTGYACLRAAAQGPCVAFVAVEAPATYFELLDAIKYQLLFVNFLAIAILVFTGLVMGGRLTRSLDHLVAATRRLGRGDLSAEIKPESRDEIGFLAHTLNDMRLDLLTRDQQMQMMLAGIAHEVRNPLGGIELFAGLLEEDLAGDPKRLELAQRIRRELKVLDRIVSDFLAYSRQMELDARPMDVVPVLHEAMALCAPAWAEQGITCETDLPGRLDIEGHADALRGVFLNLLRNAEQAMPKGGTLTVRARESGREVSVEVTDTGEGMDEVTARRVFEPFFTTRARGTGLGLPLVRKMVLAHRGNVEVHSRPGQGTQVIVTLPKPGAEISSGEFAWRE